jgi:hypothetical protein
MTSGEGIYLSRTRLFEHLQGMDFKQVGTSGYKTPKSQNAHPDTKD